MSQFIISLSLLLLSYPIYAAKYHYDDLNRLKSAEYSNNRVFTYNYDDGGNLLSIDFSGGNYTALSQWGKAQGGNCHWYGVVPANTTWSEANTQANALTHQGVQGHLATLTSAEENTFAQHLITPNTEDRYLIGGYQQHKNTEPDGGWGWVNQEPWDYTHWLTGEPSNTGSNEDYLQMRTFNGGWGDLADDSAYTKAAKGYLVEFDTGCGDSNTPDSPSALNLPEADDHGSYDLSWSAVNNTTVTHYELQEAQQADFSDATRLYAGLSTSHAITGKPAGTYYYRVRACNGSFCGAWQTAPQALPVTGVCIDQITPAYNPETGEEKEFASPCDVPDGWVQGQAPDFDGDGKNDIVDEDDDNDGIPDIWETTHGLNPKNNTDADLDKDGDGKSNLDEYLVGTDPTDNTSFATLSISLNQAQTLDNGDIVLSTSIYSDQINIDTFRVSFEYGYTPSLGSVSREVSSVEIVSLIAFGYDDDGVVNPSMTISGLDRDRTVYYRPKLVLNGKTYLGSISKLVVAGVCAYDNWESVKTDTGDTNDQISGFAYGDGVLVAISHDYIIYSSDTGVSWTQGIQEPDSYFSHVVWADNAFFAIGKRGIYKSEKGSNWQLTHEHVNAEVPNGLLWNGKQLLTIGVNGKILTSTDGFDWSEYYVGAGDFLTDVVWSNNQYAVISREGNLYTSSTGRTWTAESIGFFGYIGSPNLIANKNGLIAHDAYGDDKRFFSKLHTSSSWIVSSKTNNAYMYLWDGRQYFGAASHYKSIISLDGLNWVDMPTLFGRSLFFDNEYVYLGGSQGEIKRSRCGAPAPVEIDVAVEKTVLEAGLPFGFRPKVVVTGSNIPSTITIEINGCDTAGGLFPQTTQFDGASNTWTSSCNIPNIGEYVGAVKDLLSGKVLASFTFELKYHEPVVSGFKSEPAVIHVGDDVLFTFTGEHLRPYSDMSLDGFENCAYTVGSYASPPPGSNVTEIKYQCHAVSAGSKQGVINFSEELTHAFSVTVSEPIAIAPSIRRITPDSIIRSTSNIEVTIEGDNFTEDSQVYFQASGRKSKIADADVQFVDAQSLKFPVKPGLAGVWVFQVKNGEVISNDFEITITIPEPVVQSVSSKQVNINELTLFVIQGSNLPETLAFWVDGCADVVKLGNATASRVQFSCTPALSGLRDGVVKTQSGGDVLKTFQIEVMDVLCAQVITTAYNPKTGKEKDYSTPCDIPEGWIIGKAPDSDRDGLPDIWEEKYNLDPQDSDDAGIDSDGDGVSNLDEFAQGTNPKMNPAIILPPIIQLLLDD